jgi:hypothetical protein
VSKRSPLVFTRKETVDRLQEVKNFLGNKERLAFRATKLRFLPANYDAGSDESYFSSPKLEEFCVQSLKERIACMIRDQWFTDVSFRKLNAVDFVCWDLAGQAPAGTVIDIAFYKWERSGDDYLNNIPATKFASVWLGTWHHAPVVVWRQAGSSVIKTEIPPAYSDLIKL